MKYFTPTAILRYSFAVLFLWFGYYQISAPTEWVGFLPEWISRFPLTPEQFVLLNGWFEIVTAVLLLAGFFVRPVAAVLAIHLFGIAITAGGAIGMRDAILAMIGVALAVAEPDSLTLDARKK